MSTNIKKRSGGWFAMYDLEPDKLACGRICTRGGIVSHDLFSKKSAHEYALDAVNNRLIDYTALSSIVEQINESPLPCTIPLKVLLSFFLNEAEYIKESRYDEFYGTDDEQTESQNTPSYGSDSLEKRSLH